ncbi:MAG TPA: Spo0B domain-containing protein [Patescibacteria group bacterium]|nr:Spo0B domain-containing protein [Patescibacteria group bacterium]
MTQENEVRMLPGDSEAIRLLRRQRHDFINHLQVVYTLLQLGRNEKALAYIQKLAQDPDLISDVLREAGYTGKPPVGIP